MNIHSINDEKNRLSICIKKVFQGLDWALKDPIMKVK
jgi:hypothetical protein